MRKCSLVCSLGSNSVEYYRTRVSWEIYLFLFFKVDVHYIAVAALELVFSLKLKVNLWPLPSKCYNIIYRCVLPFLDSKDVNFRLFNFSIDQPLEC